MPSGGGAAVPGHGSGSLVQDFLGAFFTVFVAGLLAVFFVGFLDFAVGMKVSSPEPSRSGRCSQVGAVGRMS